MPAEVISLIIDRVGTGRPFGKLTNSKLRAFGATLETHVFPGVPTIFRDLRKTAAMYKGINIEFYVISGGLQEVIEGCNLISKNLSGVYGCQLGGDTEVGDLKYIKRCVTFTVKTRFLFEINKGIRPGSTQTNPYLVNKDVPPGDGRFLLRI